MPQLIIKIKDKIAKPLNNCVICSNSDYTVKFIFDEEWEKEPLRIARFIWNKQYVDVQFTGDTCEVPIISKANNLAIGVYAGDLRTTTPAILTCYTSILCEDVIEHSVTPSEYEEIMKLLNAQATDIAALKAVDKRIWTNLDTINKTASTAKIKAEEGVAKADSALARNIFTDEEKAKLANITNPMIIKGRVDTVNDLPTEAVIGWFYFVGLESASSYEEYCYSENGWEYIGLSQEGVDLSNYYTKKQVDTTVNELKAIDNSLGTRIDNVDSKASAAKVKAEEGVAKADDALTKASSNTTSINSLNTDVNSLRTDVKALKATDERIWTNLDTINKTASTAKIKAEEGVAKADDALAATRTNATNISTHETRLDSIDNTLSSHDTRITTAQQKANSVDEKVDSTNEVVGQLSTSLQSAYNKINAHANDIAINRTTLGTQCKNLLKNTAVTKTVNGVTFTVNSDGSVTVNGTNTSSSTGANLEICSFKNYGDIKLTASLKSTDSNVYMSVFDKNWVGVGIICDNEITWDNGNKERLVRLVVKPGATINNVTVYPMIRYADITDDTYEPYSDNIDTRIRQSTSNIAVNKSTLGYVKKNLLKNNAVTQTVSGVTFTINDDKSITVNGTATAQISFIINDKVGLGIGNYILTGCPSGGSWNTFYLTAYASSAWLSAPDFGSGCKIENKTVTQVVISIASGYTANNLKFYPMLRDADIIDDTYETYKESIDERLIKIQNEIGDIESILSSIVEVS